MKRLKKEKKPETYTNFLNFKFLELLFFYQ